IIHIRVDKQQPEKFTYHVLSNKDTTNTAAYLTLEAKEGVSKDTLLEVVYTLFIPPVEAAAS
ncbi:MAG: hypothetical protein AAF963_02860, partial [Bacteroidota bacterium]